MKSRNISTLILIGNIACWIAGQTVQPVHAQPNSPPQNPKTQAGQTSVDPLKSLTTSFPKSVRVKQNGHLLEFCPDNTCDGFVSSIGVPVAELKEFAYLYIFYFSDFIYLQDWRRQPEPKKVAEQILSNPAYDKCKNLTKVETARCLLLDRSRGGRIKLIFVRYDENQRNVVLEDIRKEVSERPAGTN